MAFKKHKTATPQKILIIADDLTGAVDTGVQFRKKKLKTLVVTGSENIGRNFRVADVVVVDTESRFDDKIA
ncbi:MAG TPA: four-carbon acid sugar kinase family protein, partial [Bacteroidales bacterium]|nr:four-carbon acid sugar kinase family protein [Bacteroidales bacterium]